VSGLPNHGLDIAPYRPRLTSCLRLHEFDGWRIKVYGITVKETQPDAKLVAAACELAERDFPRPATADGRQGVGFVIVHEGEEGDWVLLDWWTADLLRHRAFRSAPGAAAFTPVPPGEPTACVWELAVIDHERQVWIRHVLATPDSPDLQAYLDNRFQDGPPPTG
jgi:hypothetical protein